VYLLLHWRTPRPVPPIRNPLPIDAVAHKTIPFNHGLSIMPMINSHLVSPAPTIPPWSLMDNTYSTLKKTVREALLAKWSGLLLTPGYYHHLPTLNPRPFIGFGKFIAGRIHQMRASKSYLAAHPTWRSPDAETSCPRCCHEPETFEDAILACPSRKGARLCVLHGVLSVGPDSPVWFSLLLLKRLATFIGVTSTGFPPTMFPPNTPPSSPPITPLAPSSTPPGVPCFFVSSDIGLLEFLSCDIM